MEKWPILDQNHGLTLCKNLNFSTFWNCCFYGLERRYFVLEYRKTHFPGLYCLKKNWKMANFGPKPWVSPFEKMAIFPLFELAVFIAYKAFFRSLAKKNWWKNGQFWTKKVKKVSFFSTKLLSIFSWQNLNKETFSIFSPKAWVNPFGKMRFLGLGKIFL